MTCRPPRPNCYHPCSRCADSAKIPSSLAASCPCHAPGYSGRRALGLKGSKGGRMDSRLDGMDGMVGMEGVACLRRVGWHDMARHLSLSLLCSALQEDSSSCSSSSCRARSSATATAQSSVSVWSLCRLTELETRILVVLHTRWL